MYPQPKGGRFFQEDGVAPHYRGGTMDDLSKLCRDILLAPYPQRMPGAPMQSVPDPSWKTEGPPDDGYSDYIERFRERARDEWTVGELMDKLPTKLSSDLWMWIEERGIREFLEMRAARRSREDRDD